MKSRIALSSCLLVVTISANAAEIKLKSSEFKHITFDDIPQTKYANEGEVLTMRVDKSSSLLLMPFDTVKTVSRVKFDWQFAGNFKVKSAKEETTKDGDDSKLRVGLILSGEAPWVPFIAPAWIKAVQKNMKLETDKLVYLQPGAMHAAGKTWESPYSDSINNMSLASKPGKDGWSQVDHTFNKPYKVVGVWLMADGDNTNSVFTTKLRDLSFH